VTFSGAGTQVLSHHISSPAPVFTQLSRTAILRSPYPASCILLLALISFAASLVFFVGAGGKRNFRSSLVGAGFALLGGSFVWLWLG
jgi:hypothetical protein